MIKYKIMTKDDILLYATEITFSNQSTTLKFNNGSKLIGHFEGNNSINDENKWHFKTFLKEENKSKDEIINGDDLKSIDII